MEVHDTVTGGGGQNNPQEEELQKGKMVVEEVLQRVEDGREAKDKGEKETYPSECRVPKNSKER